MSYIKGIFLKENGVWAEYNEISSVKDKLVVVGDRVSCITSIGYERLNNDNSKGFCHNRFKANFIIGNIDSKEIYHGQQINMEDIEIEITEIHKKCYKECPIIEETGVSCKVNREIFFGKI